MTMGEKLRLVRKEKGLTQQELANRCGMAGSAVRKYESGRQVPKLETLKRLARGLEVPRRCLLPLEEDGELLQETTLEQVGPFPTPEGMRLARDYDRLDPEGQQRVREAVDWETERVAQARPG